MVKAKRERAASEAAFFDELPSEAQLKAESYLDGQLKIQRRRRERAAPDMFSPTQKAANEEP